MPSRSDRRHVDYQIITEWVETGSRVADLGCGRGLLLEALRDKRQARVVGVDVDPEKILACVKRGIPVYQGDGLAFLRQFPDGFFDRVVLSRTVEELEAPRVTIEEGLRVGRRLTVGFVNFGYWRNRLSFLLAGRRIRNEVFPERWEERRPANPFSLREFEEFCRARGIVVHRRVALSSDWATPCRVGPNLRAGYLLYDLSAGTGPAS